MVRSELATAAVWGASLLADDHARLLRSWNLLHTHFTPGTWRAAALKSAITVRRTGDDRTVDVPWTEDTWEA
jgi:hypothetical protein